MCPTVGHISTFSEEATIIKPKQTDFRSAAPMWAALSAAVVWLAAIAAYAYEDGMNLFQWTGRFSQVLERPFSIGWMPHTLKFIACALLLYAAAIALYYGEREHKRPGEEHGGAKWGSAGVLDRKYRDRKDPDNNVILTKHVQMGLDGRVHQRNLLQIVVGGSGAGKSRSVVAPNIMLANTSYIATDPKGELARATAPLLLKRGYIVRVFDLVDPAHSDAYNPFHYIRKDADVFRLVDNFIKNTTPKNAAQSDPFWEKSETALDCALMLYLLHEAPVEEQTMDMVLTMLDYAEVHEDDDEYQSPLDLLFEALKEEEPEHIAVRQYGIFKEAPGKTAMSILVSASVRLAAFTLSDVRRITSCDTLELDRLGERKQAIFCVIPDSNDTSLNFLVGMLYTQAFQELYYRADKVHGGRLPVPVRLLFDEFANVALPNGYERLQATMRSRNIMATIILQNISQLKALFKDAWEGIIGNADAFLYLGGNEQSTHKYVSELLGKETIQTQSVSQSKGRNGSYSKSTQLIGRELMTPDEVRLLDNRLSILLVRGEKPVIDEKYELMRHPNIRETEYGGAAPYVHHASCIYAADDLPFAFETLNEIEVLELEESL